MVLVTGGTGLVGGRILLELAQSGQPVKALKRATADTQWVEKLFELHMPNGYNLIQWVDGDVNDVPSLEEAMGGCHTVVHAAAVVSFHRKDRENMFKINVEGTANVVNVALGHGIKRFCHISSTAALGRSIPGEHIDEGATWKKSPLNSQYAISKYNAENEVWRGSVEGLNVVVVNPSIVIGTGNPQRSSGALFSRVMKGLKFYPGGSNGFVSADDVARACNHLLKEEVFGERFVLSSANLSYRDLFSKIATSLGKKPPTTEASPGMMNLYRIAQGLLEFFGGGRASVTKQNVRNAANQVYYDGNKITRHCSFTYGDIDKAIDDSAQYYQSLVSA